MSDTVKTPVVGCSRFRVGESLPAVLTGTELGAALFGVGRNTAWVMERRGDFTLFELLPRVGTRRRYSGKKVMEWLAGDGGAPDLRYFGSARRRRTG